jgi:hypothetical protein
MRIILGDDDVDCKEYGKDKIERNNVDNNHYFHYIK